MEEDEIYNSIHSLPDEVLTIILQYNKVKDIVSFSKTCKRFWNVVQSNEILWKDKLRSILPAIMFNSVAKHCDGAWFNAFKDFHNLRKQIYYEIIAMSPKFYWQCHDVTLEDVRHFFEIALSNNFNYFYVIFILQDMIKKGNTHVDNVSMYDHFHAHKPYTLTEMYYAKVVLRHLIHTFLAVKWVKLHMKNELLPEVVINFFLQWIDTANLHPDYEVEKRIDELEQKVEVILNTQNPKLASLPVHERCEKNLVTEKQVLDAITDAVYHQRHMAVTAAANLETLNINKVLRNRCGNAIAVGAVYHAAARRCGVRLALVAFPNHLFVEWREPGSRAPHTLHLPRGDLRPKRRCPFSQAPAADYTYCPDSLLQYIYSSFHISMGAIRNWNTQNAFHLLDFLGTSHNHLNPYRNFLPYLIHNNHLPAMNTPLDLTYLSDAHIQLIRSLANLNLAEKPVFKDFVVKRHASIVKYAVGMICYHKKFDYVGIVRGWDVSGEAKWAEFLGIEVNLQFGLAQPFYYIIAADQSNKYVAQENLVEITRPTRLYHLEDAVARDFTHFDGFAYVPNEEKRAEYPDEGPITSLYRTRSYYRR